MNKKFYFHVCKELIYCDLLIFKQTFIDKYIDLAIWVILTIVVTGYVMPFFGLANTFGVFQLGSVIAATGLFELYTSAIDLVSDFEGDRIINYNLTLPIPSWLAIISKTMYYTIVYCILAIAIFPIGKLCLWNQLDLMNVQYPRFLLVVLFQSTFYACFLLWAASITANISKLGTIWARFIFPMWFMGGFQFSWTALHKALPLVSYINLANPMMYITEAIRSTIFEQMDYINYWLCLGMIAFFSLLFLTHGLTKEKYVIIF